MSSNVLLKEEAPLCSGVFYGCNSSKRSANVSDSGKECPYDKAAEEREGEIKAAD